ncbi:MAG: phosphoglucosamine mutase [Actinomycetota bacterium]|nr:phosphoglucosamine mutase [Actinomycetota bacterium]
MGRLFGTDGVRGLANKDLTAEIALDLAVAAAHVLGDIGAFAGHRPKAVVGRDTRASGEFLEAAVVAGLASAGVDVILIGVAPTPAVAYLTDALGADLGVMLSASHNPMPDNGIKFFNRGGLKLDDDIEDAIEARLLDPWAGSIGERPTGEQVGRVRADHGAMATYEQHLLDSLPNDLTGLKVVVDCANGAASFIAPEVLRRAGAEVIAIHSAPDGLNINDGCGSTHLEDLRAAVLKNGADAGIAHDGDADRCLAIDELGAIVDGDHILAILAMSLRDAGRLAENTVVSTVMANLGFKIAMQEANILVVETAVGDRYVLEEMRANGYLLGGEQSGHIVMSDFATTGDGLLTALQLLARACQTGRSLRQLASLVTKLPQVLINVTGVDRSRLDGCAEVDEAVTQAAAALGEKGRILLRPSGTEPVIRVMVEAPTLEQAQSISESIAAVVRVALREH